MPDPIPPFDPTTALLFADLLAACAHRRQLVADGHAMADGLRAVERQADALIAQSRLLLDAAPRYRGLTG